MTELYAKYMELILGRWDIDKGLQSQKEYEALNNIVMRMSQFMLENELDGISVSETREMFVEYLAERNLGVSPDELFEKMQQRCEVITVNESSNLVSFKHKSFAEFLCAKSFLANGKLKIDNRVFQPYWINIYFFGLGLKKDAPDQLQAIMDISPESEGERWVKVFCMGDYFLAAYATPYALISEGVKHVMLEASALYLSTVEGTATSPFSHFPRMQLLFILQYVIKHNYSYSFFKKAIEDSIYSIENEVKDERVRPYALFFPIMAHKDLASGDSFDFILNELGSAMPLDITLAVSAEADNIKNRSNSLKKHDKRVERMLKGNAGLKSQINEWFKTPISKLTE